MNILYDKSRSYNHIKMYESAIGHGCRSDIAGIKELATCQIFDLQLMSRSSEGAAVFNYRHSAPLSSYQLLRFEAQAGKSLPASCHSRLEAALTFSVQVSRLQIVPVVRLAALSHIHAFIATARRTDSIR